MLLRLAVFQCFDLDDPPLMPRRASILPSLQLQRLDPTAVHAPVRVLGVLLFQESCRGGQSAEAAPVEGVLALGLREIVVQVSVAGRVGLEALNDGVR